MKEIYWVTTLSKISTITGCLSVLCAFLLIFLILLHVIISVDGCSYDKEDKLKAMSTTRKSMKRALTITCIALPLYLFTPSKNDCLAIFGIGSIVEFVKSSDEAKALPDNAVKALNQWLTEMTKDE